jgi:hypothetical protein
MSELTRRQKSALEVLARRHANHTYLVGFHAGHLGAHSAAALRRIEGTGFVKIDRQAENSFRYSITEEGLSYLASTPNQAEAWKP